MGNTPLKKYSSGKNLFAVVALLLFSCSSIQQAVIQAKPVTIGVEKYEPWASPVQSYHCEVKTTGADKEFHVTQNGVTTIYQLPSNKLTLLYEMEMGLKDVKTNHAPYYKVTITSNRVKKIYKINTDLINNFITGLKKK